jgi:MHS family alpha-ketoglutarate permease-like MFS transporter
MTESITSHGTLANSDTRRRVWAIVSASSGNLVEWFDFTSTHSVHSTSHIFSSHPATPLHSCYKRLGFLPQGFNATHRGLAVRPYCGSSRA